MAGVELVGVIRLSEDDLFCLDEYIDNQLAENQSFKDDGVLHFTVDSGEGTSLEELLLKFSTKIKGSLKKLNPITVPYSQDFYGHIALDEECLDSEEVKGCMDTLLNPHLYSESDDNCCLSALNERGVDGLLCHYFEEKFKGEASNPPQFKLIGMGSASAKKCALKLKQFDQTKSMLSSSKSPAEKCAVVSKCFLKKNINEEKTNKIDEFCSCWMCVYSDEVLQEDEESNELVPQIEQTAMHYKGKGFFYANGINVNAGVKNMVSSNFSLSFLNCVTPTCLLDGDYPGINSSYLYFGLSHSFFPLHIEDLSLFSVNFLHRPGYPKTWVVVPPTSISKLHHFVSREFGGSGQHSTCIGLLSHKYFVPTPAWLRRNGIPFKVVVQRNGEGVILAPNAAHFGFNMGPNCAEAINFASKAYLPYGIVYPKCTCMPGQVHADLTAVIKSQSPELLGAYKAGKVPVVSSPYFLKSIVQSHLWRESFEMNVEGGDSNSEIGEEDGADPPPKKKKRPNRKIIMCPVCQKTFQGGQKARLQDHLASTHANLSVEEDIRVKAAIGVMFPERGFKLPKKKCTLCGKAVARAMVAHQKSNGCIPKIVSV